MSLTTKRALSESFKKLLGKRGIDKITVKDIVEDCGVNRQTFYYHFHDIYDLLEWQLKDTAEKLLEKKTDYSDWTAGMESVMEYVQENRALVLNAYHSISHDTLMEDIKLCLRPYAAEVVRTQAEGIEPPPAEEDLDLVTDIFTQAAVGFLMDWIGKNMKREKTSDRLRRFHTAINGSARFMLENLSREDWEENKTPEKEAAELTE